MDGYTITMKRSSHISDAERRRRLYAAYSLLLSLSEDAKTDGQRESADPDQPASGDVSAPQQETEAQGAGLTTV